jgi:hypothetical protein
MREYADDVDIAPIELMIVVRTVIHRFYGQPMVCPGPPVSCRTCHDRDALLTIYYRTRATPQGLPLVQTSAAYLTFITLGGSSSCVHDPPVAHALTCDSRVAALLQDHGFDGIIQSPDVQRRDDISGKNWKRGDPPPRIANTAFQWPRYMRSKPEIIYPAVLVATTPEPFRLSLPCPTIRHTLDLLHSYGRKNPLLRQIICLLYIWMRSWDINEISPVTLSLLVIRFFQVLCNFTSLKPYFSD